MVLLNLPSSLKLRHLRFGGRLSIGWLYSSPNVSLSMLGGRLLRG